MLRSCVKKDNDNQKTRRVSISPTLKIYVIPRSMSVPCDYIEHTNVEIKKPITKLNKKYKIKKNKSNFCCWCLENKFFEILFSN
jgi:hypothetical protein